MDDHDLNAAMARLCGIPRRTRKQVYGPSTIETTSPFIYRHDLFRPMMGGRTCEHWDPAGNWNQVHDYVIPALQRAGGNVNLEYDNDSLHATITPNDSDGWIVARGIIDPRPLPRFFCELALEAFEKLGADSAK